MMSENKKKNAKKPRFDKRKQDDKRKQPVGDRVVYTTKTEGPERKADWQVAERPLDHVSLSVGPCASLPLGGGFGIGMHLRGGYGFYPKTSLVGLEVGASRGWGFEGGLSVGYLTSRRVSLRFVADYRSWSSPLVGVDNQGFSLGLSAGWGW